MSVFIIAEAGVNHNGRVETAKRLVDVAVEAGADAVKFQTFRAERLASRNTPKAEYQAKGSHEESQVEMLKKLELSFEAFRSLKNYCDSKKTTFLSTPFDEESAGFLVHELNMEVIKIGSGEVTNLPFLKVVATLNRPIILSTGMSFLHEVEEAVRTIQEVSPNTSLTLLHCTTSYPCSFGEVNLKAMQTLKEHFRLPVGYSDHTPGIEVAIAASALGATVIEKHFTLDRNLEGPDHAASLEPAEFKQMVRAIRNIESSLGSGWKEPTASEKKNRPVARRSLVLTKTLKKGSIIREGDVTIKRPGSGIPPGEFQKVIGLKLKVDKQEDEVLTWQDIEPCAIFGLTKEG